MTQIDDELEEILQPWQDEINSEHGTGIDDDKKPQFIQIREAKAAIKQLIEAHTAKAVKEARIEEVGKAGAIYGYFAGDREFNADTELPIIHVNGYPQKEEMHYRRSQLAENTLSYLKSRLKELQEGEQ